MTQALVRTGAKYVAKAMLDTLADAGKQRGEAATKDFVHREINALEVRLVRWIVGTVFAAAGLLFLALRFIP